MAENVDKLVVELTPDQIRLLVMILDNADIKGRAAALVVGIQQALAAASAEPPVPHPDTTRAPA